jgi:acyl carrier protein
MEKESLKDIITELNEIFCDVFEDDELVVSRDTSAADVDAWDSLQHVTLILRVESHFGVRFSSAEVADLSSVGDLLDILSRRLKGN